MIYVVSVVTTVLVLVLVTAYKTSQLEGRADFLVAGRALPWPVLVFTLLSSWVGAGSLLGGAENAYKNGMVALWQPLGGWIGLLVIWKIAGRARRFAQFTVPDLLETRYNVGARVLGTLAIVVAYTVITSYQFIGGGDILHLIFPDISRQVGLYIVAAFVIAFTAAAGMSSIAYLDLIIGSLVTLTLLCAVPMLLTSAGGWSAVTKALPASHFTLLGSYTLPGALGLTLPTMLLLIGNQGVYQKFFSARSEEDARKSVVGWILGTITLETLLVVFAVIASSMLRTTAPREIIALTAKSRLPPVIGAILLGGVFAKVISTANNYLFSPASNLIHDVYERFINPNASASQSLLVSRSIVVLLGLFAVLQASQFTSILSASLYAYTIYGAAITPCVLAVFFWDRASGAGAIASIVAGTLITVCWQFAQMSHLSFLGLPFQSLDAVYPALGVSVFLLVAVSLWTGPPSTGPSQVTGSH